jgi:cytochrome c biogenesis protein CcmG, thiol:disulfide interchange protein DsbE
MSEQSQTKPPTRRISGVRLLSVAIGIGLLGLIGVLATRDSALDRRSKSPLVGQPAPEIQGTSVIDGADVKLSALSGGKKFVVINFFSSNCVPCVKEHPEFLKFVEEQKTAQDAEVMAVVYQDNLDDVRDFFKVRGGNWPVLDSDLASVNYGVTGVPETFLVDPNGMVFAKFTGATSSKALTTAIDEWKTLAAASNQDTSGQPPADQGTTAQTTSSQNTSDTAS